jgi:membrane associated rhomboid family serine protease
MSYSSGFQNPFGFVVTPWVKRLLIANGVVFLITLAFRGLVPYLVLTPALLFPQVWTVVTYMFVHVGGFFHLFFNMLALFFFGPPLEDRWGGKEFLKFYFLAGVGGALLSLAFPYSIGGASAAVYGVMVAFAMYWPNNPIYIWGIFPVKAKWLVGLLVGLSLFYAVSGGQAGVAHFAHLGGAIAAFLYLKSPYAPSQWGEVTRKSTGSRSWNPLAGAIKARPKKPAEPTPTPVARSGKTREAFRSLDDVDHILDKISQGGMSSLTDDERRRLDEASRRFRAS